MTGDQRHPRWRRGALRASLAVLLACALALGAACGGSDRDNSTELREPTLAQMKRAKAILATERAKEVPEHRVGETVRAVYTTLGACLQSSVTGSEPLPQFADFQTQATGVVDALVREYALAPPALGMSITTGDGQIQNFPTVADFYLGYLYESMYLGCLEPRQVRSIAQDSWAVTMLNFKDAVLGGRAKITSDAEHNEAFFKVLAVNASSDPQADSADQSPPSGRFASSNPVVAVRHFLDNPPDNALSIMNEAKIHQGYDLGALVDLGDGFGVVCVAAKNRSDPAFPNNPDGAYYTFRFYLSDANVVFIEGPNFIWSPDNSNVNPAFGREGDPTCPSRPE